jgi:hypothetical protein
MSISPGVSKTVEMHKSLGGVRSVTKNPTTPVVYGRTRLGGTQTVVPISGLNHSNNKVTITGHGMPNGTAIWYNSAGGTNLNFNGTPSPDGEDGSLLFVANTATNDFNISATYAGGLAGTGTMGIDDGQKGNDSQIFTTDPLGYIY